MLVFKRDLTVRFSVQECSYLSPDCLADDENLAHPFSVSVHVYTGTGIIKDSMIERLCTLGMWKAILEVPFVRKRI